VKKHIAKWGGKKHPNKVWARGAPSHVPFGSCNWRAFFPAQESFANDSQMKKARVWERQLEARAVG
jgi:hypothetical protein